MIRLEYLLRLTYGTPMVTTRVSAVGLVEIIPIGHQHWCVVGDWIKSWMEIFHSEMKLVRCAEYLLRLTLKTLVVTTRVSILVEYLWRLTYRTLAVITSVSTVRRANTFPIGRRSIVGVDFHSKDVFSKPTSSKR